MIIIISIIVMYTKVSNKHVVYKTSSNAVFITAKFDSILSHCYNILVFHILSPLRSENCPPPRKSYTL